MKFIRNPLFPELKKLKEVELEICNEQISIAFRQMPLGLLTIVVGSIVLGMIQWNVISHTIILVWIGLQLSIVLWRFDLYRLFLTSFSEETAEKFKSDFLIRLTISSASFGSTAFFLFPSDNLPNQAFLAFIMAGMGAGSVTTLSSIKRAPVIFLSFILIPLIIVFLLEQNMIHNLMALMVGLFWITMIIMSKRFYNNLYNTIESKILYNNALQALQLTEERFVKIFEEAPAGIFYYDKNGIIQEANNEMSKVLNVDKSTLIGLDMNILPNKNLLSAILAVFDETEGHYEGFYHTMIAGLDLHISLRTSPIYDENRKVIGGVGIGMDITEQKNFEKVISRLAHYDSLTDIPNRLLIMERIEHSIIVYKRHDIQSAVIFVDLDRFKSINDSLGHHIGDELLKDVAKRIRNTIREEDTVSRLGGDEFVILIPNLGTDIKNATNNVEHIAEKIHETLSKPFYLKNEHMLSVTSSIGVAFINHKEESASDLLKHADSAMYRAKKEGRNTTRFYQEEMDKWVKRRHFLENTLRNAIANNELELYYQPVIEMKTKHIVGAEALLRWNHPEQGLVMPDEIIDIAEESGLIVPIGEWVLREACTQFVRWRSENLSQSHIDRIAVNVSAVQFRQFDFVDKVIRIVVETGLVPSMLELELTESIIIDNIDTIIDKMNRLRKAGIGVSMDDFGTGYSSLAYLKRLPFTTLKIDRSFVRDIMSDSDDAALVETILSMASIFKLDVIAEGVETIEQFKFLEEHGCQYFQGYLCSKPVPVLQFEELLTHDVQSCAVQ